MRVARILLAAAATTVVACSEAREAGGQSDPADALVCLEPVSDDELDAAIVEAQQIVRESTAPVQSYLLREQGFSFEWTDSASEQAKGQFVARLEMVENVDEVAWTRRSVVVHRCTPG